MKDYIMGLRSSGGWLTFCATIISSSTSNSSSSSTLFLGFCRMVRSISISIGRMVGFLDQSPCMNWLKFCQLQQLQYCCSDGLWNCTRSLLEVCSITLGLRSITITGTILPQTWNNTENRKQLFFYFFFKKIIKIKQNNSKTKLK
jgi:hypothetical protein